MTVVRAAARPFVSSLFLAVTLCTLVMALLAGAWLPAQAQARNANQILALNLPRGIQPESSLQPQRSLSMVSADFNEDGVADLAIGYAASTGGAIAVLPGSLDAIAPQSQASWLAAGRHQATVPFLPAPGLIQLTATPDMLISADVNGDGHADLVYASTGSGLLQVLPGTGKGSFSPQALTFTLPGSITALASYRPGGPVSGEALLVGLQTTKGAQLAILSNGAAGLSLNATYTMPGPVTSLAIANLDGDFTPDAAIVAGGKLLVLHGANAITGGGQLETLSVEEVETVTSGEFLMDRHGLPQLAVLTANGDVLILAHQGFDARPYTPQEIAAQRHLRPGSPTLMQLAGDTSKQPWTVVETNSGAGAHSTGSAVPILLTSHISGSGEDLVVLNSLQQQRVTISHSAVTARGTLSIAPRVAAGSIATSNLIAAVSVRVNADGRPGLALLSQSGLTPEFTVPSAGNTFYVNTTADNTGANTDTDDGTRCSNGSGETCTLRDAVTFANNDASDNIGAGKSDTIMLPAGTYGLSWQAGTLDANGSAVTHLEILGPVSIVGAGTATTIINANSHDVAFTINPGSFGSFNPSGNSYVFDASISDLTIENGKNPDNPNTDSNSNYVGGGINWDAYGTGNLTLTDVNVENCTIPYYDGGGLWVENSSGGGAGKLTITGGTISGNTSPDTGGGINDAYPPVAMAISNTTISGNTANPSVNSGIDSGGFGSGGGIEMDEPGGVSTPQSTFTNVTIESNSALEEGGGIHTLSPILLTGSLVKSNSVTVGSGGQGGGIWISLNSPDQATITSTDILQNSVTSGQGGGIYIGADSGNQLKMSLSRIYGNTASGTTGLAVESPATATATDNWWGCNAGPTSASCNKADSGATTNPWAELGISVSPSTIDLTGSTTLSVTMDTDSIGSPIAGAFPAVGTNYNIALNLSGTGGSGSATGTFDSTGVYSTSLTPTTAGVDSISATFDGQTVSTSVTVETLSSFTVSAPGTATAGTPINVSVTANQSTGGTLTAYAGTVHFTSTDAAATLPADYTFVSGDNGVHTFSVTLNTAGNQTVTATDTSNSATGTSGVIAVAAISPVLAVSMSHTGTFTQGSTGYWNLVVSNTGTVTTSGTTTLSDVLPAGYTLAGYSGTGWSCTGTATVTCTSTLAVAAAGQFGALQFTVNIPANSPTSVTNTAIVYGGGDLTHTNAGNGASGSDTVTVVQVPASVTLAAGNNQSTSISTAFSTPLSVTVKDAGSNPVSGVSVTFTAPSSGASGIFSNSTNTITAVTNASGIASAPFTANSIAGGPYTVSASVASLSAVNFSLTNTVGQPTSMTANSGTTPQSATINNAFATALAVTVKDAGSNPVPGVTVTFASPASGASGTFSNSLTTISVVTNASGIASASFTANGTVGGPYTVTATAIPVGLVNFNLTNAAIQATITLGSLNQTYNGSPHAATSTTTPTGLSVAYTYTGIGGTSYPTNAAPPTAAGSYTVAATITSPDYAGSNSGTLVIAKAPVTATAGSYSGIYDGSTHALSACAVTGAYTGSLTCTNSPTGPVGPGAGSGTITPTVNGDTTNFNVTSVNGSWSINKAMPVINWTAPTPIPYGMALSATQLDATSPLPGNFVYSPSFGAVLPAGLQTLSVTFTPTDSTDYSTATASVQLTVIQPRHPSPNPPGGPVGVTLP